MTHTTYLDTLSATRVGFVKNVITKLAYVQLHLYQSPMPIKTTHIFSCINPPKLGRVAKRK